MHVIGVGRTHLRGPGYRSGGEDHLMPELGRCQHRHFHFRRPVLMTRALSACMTPEGEKNY